MTSVAPPSPHAATPRTRMSRTYWQRLLGARGLSYATITHFGLSPRRQGWLYPVAPQFEASRWKAFDSSATPKYLWLPNKPDGVRFYDVDGKLGQRITDTGGGLWLASGEADVWALWEGGIGHATCMFDGESRRIPEWFVAELARLGVKMVLIAPDRDETGMRFAVQVCKALMETAIRVVAYELPFAMDSRGDIGKLLIQVGTVALQNKLENLPELVVDTTAVMADDGPREPIYWQLPLPKILPDYRAMYEQWSTEVVETAALRRWNISPPNRKGFSKSFHCPFHDDHHPSASWNYHIHGIHCFACGSHDTKEVADQLGILRWDDFKKEQQIA